MRATKIAISSLFLAVLSLSNAISVTRENSLAGPYIADSDNLVFWDMIGTSQLGGGYIRLTTDDQEKHGGIWNNFPVIANSWEFQTHFHIHGKGVYLNGDGMAFWYVRDSLHSGPVFGSKDYFSGLGVFIDTFENKKDPHKHRHPYVSAMVNNGSLHYEHDEDGTMTQIGGCYVPVRNLEVPTKMAISYANQNLAVYLDYEGLSQWKLCFRSQGVHLPTGYFYGITASTSDVSDNHDIISATALSLDSSDIAWEDRSDIIPEAENVKIPEKYHKDFIEEELQKIQKRNVHEETLDEEEEEADDADGAADTTTEEVDNPPSTSLLIKFIYVAGAAIIIMIAISTYRKYSERRRERMQKRLF